ncbi:hypothetical protein BpHYR1_021834 [Brachionus plicatilis]|uniref:Uncharacterized protein n=1 Tax=Brachionus plicatilis TaxID=10195 RepID=A0A3M7T450_BRAPC|nr:hypothetical protein BpHYR1_021834 [Brachionus plicatilis]
MSCNKFTKLKFYFFIPVESVIVINLEGGVINLDVFGQNYQADAQKSSNGPKRVVADLVVLQLKKEIQKIVLSENIKSSFNESILSYVSENYVINLKIRKNENLLRRIDSSTIKLFLFFIFNSLQFSINLKKHVNLRFILCFFVSHKSLSPFNKYSHVSILISAGVHEDFAKPDKLLESDKTRYKSHPDKNQIFKIIIIKSIEKKYKKFQKVKFRIPCFSLMQ